MIIKEIKTKDDYQSFIKDGGRVLVFHAEWCNPCKMLGETLKHLDEEKTNGFLFGEIDVDTEELEDVIIENRIRNVPVLVFFWGGFERLRTVGSIPATEIYNTLDKIRDVVATDN